jgi:hypothetical protein
MFTKIYKIENLKNVRIDVNCLLDDFIIVVKERINMQWIDVCQKRFKVDIKNFEIQPMINEIFKEYVDKKAVEEFVRNELHTDEHEILVLPQVKYIKGVDNVFEQNVDG